jgi:pectate lyase
MRHWIFGAALALTLTGCAQYPWQSSWQDSWQSLWQKPAPSRDISREVLAANDGWGAGGAGTRGGADAKPEHVFEVHNRAELVAALALGQAGGEPSSTPKIVKVLGKIDLSVDDANRPLGLADYSDPAFDFEAYLKAYDPAVWNKKKLEGPLEEARLRSVKKQAARTTIHVPSNTTLVGVGTNARVVNGMLMLNKVSNIIIRNIHFADAYDFFPGWDPKDNAGGEWNSEYDDIALRGATQVWVDHCSFTDGDHPDASAKVAFGRLMQHHDGFLDITQQSNFVTVSFNHFKDHDKTSLVGSSDSQKLDEGKLKVTYHHNLWERVNERAPRVRYGEVHVYNNLYVAGTGAPYPFGYSIGVGFNSHVFSENNVWETPAGVSQDKLARLWKGSAFFDRGSLHNGRPVDLFEALKAANPGTTISADVGWQPQLHGPIEPAAEVARSVRASAGAGRI